MNNNTDIEELRKEIDKIWNIEVSKSEFEDMVIKIAEIVQQKVTEAQRNVAQRIALDGNPGYAATRLAAELQAQLNHNKKGDSK